MYHKKYGKIRPLAYLSAELEMTEPWMMPVFGIIFAAIGVTVRSVVGSPYIFLLSLGVLDLVPPAWLMTFLWTLSFFVIGAAFGFVLGYRTGGRDPEKYKGGMLFLLLAVAELCWYPLFFSAKLVFLSALLSVLILCVAVATAVNFFRVSGFPGGIMALHCVWLCYFLILNFAVLFHA